MECDSIQYAYLAVSYQAPWWDNLYMSGIINHSFCQLELPGSEHVLNSVLLVRGPNIPPYHQLWTKTKVATPGHS